MACEPTLDGQGAVLHVLRQTENPLATVREHQSLGRAQKKGLPTALFKYLQAAPDRRVTDPQLPGSATQRAAAGYRQKDPHVTPVHASPHTKMNDEVATMA